MGFVGIFPYRHSIQDLTGLGRFTLLGCAMLSKAVDDVTDGVLGFLVGPPFSNMTSMA